MKPTLTAIGIAALLCGCGAPSGRYPIAEIGNQQRAMPFFNSGNREIQSAVRKRSTGDSSGFASDLSLAIADFSSAIESDPHGFWGAESYKQRGFAKSLLTDWEGAMADYDTAIKVDPRHAYSGYIFEGDVESKRSNWAQAIADYNCALDLNPSYPQAYRIYEKRANAETKKGDTAAAEADLDQAFALIAQAGFAETGMLTSAKRLVSEGASYSLDATNAEQTYAVGVYMKMLGDSQSSAGVTDNANEFYAAAAADLTTARDSFVQNPSTDPRPVREHRSRRASSSGGGDNEFWRDTGLFLLDVAASAAGSAAGASVQYNQHLNLAKTYALSRAKTVPQYDRLVKQQMKNVHPVPAQISPVSASVSVSSAPGAETVSTVSDPPSQGPRAHICDQLLAEIQTKLDSAPSADAAK